MSKLRRFVQADRPFFITNITYQRQKILIANAGLLLDAINRMACHGNFELLAWVVLDDHFHLIINPEANEISRIMHSIKISFGNSLRIRLGQRSGRIWQHRFWDHMIRDEFDLNRHLDYIHYNPVKHGYVKRPSDWPYSSFHDYRELYQSDWGCREESDFDGEFGE